MRAIRAFLLFSACVASRYASSSEGSGMAEITQDGHEMREVPDELPRLLRQARMNSSDNWLLETSEECYKDSKMEMAECIGEKCAARWSGYGVQIMVGKYGLGHWQKVMGAYAMLSWGDDMWIWILRQPPPRKTEAASKQPLPPPPMEKDRAPPPPMEKDRAPPPPMEKDGPIRAVGHRKLGSLKDRLAPSKSKLSVSDAMASQGTEDVSTRKAGLPPPSVPLSKARMPPPQSTGSSIDPMETQGTEDLSTRKAGLPTPSVPHSKARMPPPQSTGSSIDPLETQGTEELFSELRKAELPPLPEWKKKERLPPARSKGSPKDPMEIGTRELFSELRKMDLDSTGMDTKQDQGTYESFPPTKYRPGRGK